MRSSPHHDVFSPLMVYFEVLTSLTVLTTPGKSGSSRHIVLDSLINPRNKPTGRQGVVPLSKRTRC